MSEDTRLDRTERRIVGTLIEKSFTVPDAYPLTLNALVSGCSQKSNRDPVVDIPEHHIEGALKSLFMKGWVEKNSRHGGRVARWGHRAVDRLGIDEPRLAILAEMLLRGPQTLGALRGRASRMVPLASTDVVLELLEDLARPEHGLVEMLPRATGERAEKWRHLMGGEAPTPVLHEPAEVATPTPVLHEPPEVETPPVAEPAPDRVNALEAEVRELRDEVGALRDEVARLRDDRDGLEGAPGDSRLPGSASG